MKRLMCQDTSLNSVETPLAPAHVIVDPPKRCAQTCLGGTPPSLVQNGKILAFIMATQPRTPEKFREPWVL